MYTGDYRAVTIEHGPNCCRSASAIHGKRFLSSNAPKLPLANCAIPGLCQCEYRPLHDRREDPPPKQTLGAWLKQLAHRLAGAGKRRTHTA